MEEKMKKIPFDLERAKRGEAFRMFEGDEDCFLIAEYNGNCFVRFGDHSGDYKPMLKWHHLIPDEPKPERWAVVSKAFIYNSKESAEVGLSLYSDHNYTVVKLAD